MASVFVSYSRESEALVGALVRDIEALGHDVWYDQELTGGQSWWDRILETIRDCDLFVFVVDSVSQESTACKREYNYADALGVPVLPVLVSREVSINLLPPALAQIQFVDYVDHDRDAAFRLARAFTAVPPREPLPEPLPEPPELPISYLGSLTERVESPDTLSYEQQSALIGDLRRSLRDGDTAEDARTLLERLRKRRDLLATLAEDIDELLAPLPAQASQASQDQEATTSDESGNEPNPTSPGTKPVSPGAVVAPKRGERALPAMIGGGLGLLCGLIAIATTSRLGLGEFLVSLILPPVAGAGSGAMTAGKPSRIAISVFGAFAAWFVGFSNWEGSDALAGTLALFAPVGAIVGAAIALFFAKLSSKMEARR